MSHRKIIFVIADGQRARIVERSGETGHFATVEEMDGSHGLKAARAWAKSHPPGRTVESHGAARHAVGPEDPYSQVKAEFAGEVAAMVGRRVAAGGGEEPVVLIAPSHILAELRRRLDPSVKVADTLAKDLGKTPDSELHQWLDSLEIAALPL